MHALAETDVPVARLLTLCGDEGVIGRSFYVMGFVEGRVLWDPLPGITPAERATIYDETNRVIAALHTVNVEAAGLSTYGKPAITSSGKSGAGASSTWHPKPKRSTR